MIHVRETFRFLALKNSLYAYCVNLESLSAPDRPSIQIHLLISLCSFLPIILEQARLCLIRPEDVFPELSRLFNDV